MQRENRERWRRPAGLIVTGQAMLEQVTQSMLLARASLLAEFNKLHNAVLKIVREDEVCRQCMTAPGVVAVVFYERLTALGNKCWGADGQDRGAPLKPSARMLDAQTVWAPNGALGSG
jgi:hypothetical protein